MDSSVHTDPRCILIQDALNFVDNMDTKDIAKKILYAEACAYFWNFVYTWDNIFEHPVYNYLDVILNALDVYIENQPSPLAIECKQELIRNMPL